jgi:hypothetical protein
MVKQIKVDPIFMSIGKWKLEYEKEKGVKKLKEFNKRK